MDRLIATIPFSDGVSRPVMEGSDGRQYVVDDDGGRVYETWVPPADEPAVVIGALI